jgi:protein transport protein SEC31
MVPRNFNWDIGREGLVKQNILIGNYEGAIDAALKCGRTAEALIIAYSVDQNLFNNTLKTFFTETTDNFITDVLKHIAYKDALELVRKYDLGKWKECVALIHTLAPRDKRPALLRVLADRLRSETDLAALETSPNLLPENYAPVICYILAEDFAEIANIYWLNIGRLRSGTVDRKAAALEYGRRLLAIFEGITVEVADSRIFHKLVKEVAFIALEEGEKSLSHSLFVKYLPSNCQRHVDYLVHSCKELEQYKASVAYKPIILPAMAKKQTKQAAKSQQQEAPKKKNIFAKEEEKPAPPPPSKKRQEEESNVGFSPYENNPAPKQPTNAPKKNLNTPPPPPVAPKKAPVHQAEEEPEREREREPPIAKTNPPPPKKGPAPPPPPPTHSHSFHSIPE